MRKKSVGCGCLSFIVLIIFAFLLFIILVNYVQIKNTRTYEDISVKYIEQTEDLAKSIAKKYNIFASVVMAQSALESNWGTSGLSKEYNNYFGIKSNKGVSLKTTEFIEGKSVYKEENFAVYNSKKESFHAYAKLITKAPRYERVKKAKDYKEAAKALYACGYATDPNYSQKIINLIEKYEFYKLDE